jgi:hypothetical protein
MLAHHPKEFGRIHDTDAPIYAEVEQVSISGDNEAGPSFESTLQDAVIIRIGTDDADSLQGIDDGAQSGQIFHNGHRLLR